MVQVHFRGEYAHLLPPEVPVTGTQTEEQDPRETRRRNDRKNSGENRKEEREEGT